MGSESGTHTLKSHLDRMLTISFIMLQTSSTSSFMGVSGVMTRQ